MANLQTIGLQPSFGFGDRTGLATPGHVGAIRAAGASIVPLFAQQSIREMTRTGRTPAQVIRQADVGMQQAGWSESSGADADHLKTAADVTATVSAGFTWFTIDPSEYVDATADTANLSQLQEKYALLRDQIPWIARYEGQTIRLESGAVLELDQTACLRTAVKYGLAIEHAKQMARAIDRECAAVQRDYEIELSIDETAHPTSLPEHYIIASECLSDGMRLVSLAPRFLGSFEKGVDYRGDVAAFERSLQHHAAIARRLGPYKLSLHSGSDKLAIYPALARHTQGLFHVKTAGTSYLESLRVAAHHDGALFRQIVAAARRRYAVDRATYHVSAELTDAPEPHDDLSLSELERHYLGRWEEVPAGKGFTVLGRQIVHCTFGSVLTDPHLGRALLDLLRQHQDTYARFLTEHFRRHLVALRS